MAETSKTANLLTNLHQLRKTYIIYDTQGRISATYEAKDNAGSGEPCLLTVYSYRGVATSNIRTQKEYNSNWDPDNQGWDADIQTAFNDLPSPLVDPAP